MSVQQPSQRPADNQDVVNSIQYFKVGKTTDAYKSLQKLTDSKNLAQEVSKIGGVMNSVDFSNTYKAQRSKTMQGLTILEKNFESLAESERALGSKILDLISPGRKG